MKPPIFTTERFILRPYEEGDENRFVEIAIDKDVIEFMGDNTKDLINIEKLERSLFKTIFDIYEKNENRWFWIWGVYEGKKLVAHFELKETQNTSADELEIVYMVHPDERKKGVMSEILQFVKEKQIVWKKKIIATVNPNNKNSIFLLEKWGVEKKDLIFEKKSDSTYYKLWLD